MKVYTTKNRYNCGPCSFINLTSLKGNKRLERQLAETGRVQPFRLSLYSSFLIWSHQKKKPVVIYTDSTSLNHRSFKTIFRYEQIPPEQHGTAEEVACTHLRQIRARFPGKIRRLGDPIKRLDRLLDEGHRVAVLIASYYPGRKHHTPHWIVAYKRKRHVYSFLDSRSSRLVKLTRPGVLKGFALNRHHGFAPQLVAYKNVQRRKRCVGI